MMRTLHPRVEAVHVDLRTSRWLLVGTTRHRSQPRPAGSLSGLQLGIDPNYYVHRAPNLEAKLSVWRGGALSVT